VNDENPLIDNHSIDDIAELCAESCLESGVNVYKLVLDACFQSKSQGVDECMHLIDSMLNADTSQLTRNERNMMLQTLNNLRTFCAYQRELMIKSYDKQV